jgi:erythromycin esterase-like protein
MLYQRVPLRAQAARQANTLDGTRKEHMEFLETLRAHENRSINATDRPQSNHCPARIVSSDATATVLAKAADPEPV